MLAPNTFPKATPCIFFIDAIIAVESSGKEVPIANNDNPITHSDTPNSSAICTDPSIRNLEPIINPIILTKIFIKINEVD